MQDDNDSRLLSFEAAYRRRNAVLARLDRAYGRVVRAHASALAAQALHEQVLAEIDDLRERTCHVSEHHPSEVTPKGR